jgi:hypothetical protein
MSAFTSIYFDLDKGRKESVKTPSTQTDKIPHETVLNAVEKKIDHVFSNMKKRNSNTNFQIDYPWLTI